MQEHRLQEHPLGEHRLQEHLGTSSAGTSSAGTSSGAAATRFEGDETPDCEEEGGDFPPVTQKTTAPQRPDPWIGMWLDGYRRRLG